MLSMNLHIYWTEFKLAIWFCPTLITFWTKELNKSVLKDNMKTMYGKIYLEGIMWQILSISMSIFYYIVSTESNGHLFKK